MKLSAAILAGCDKKPQGFGPSSMLHKEVACVLATALLGVVLSEDLLLVDPYMAVCGKWPWTMPGFSAATDIKCPACDRKDAPCSIIIHLNDGHAWTRERIAEFVATIEPKETV